MQRRRFLDVVVVALGLVMVNAGLFAQQAPAPVAPPPLMWREVWRQVLVGGTESNFTTRRINPATVTNPNLELKVYGEQAALMNVIVQQGHNDIWTGLSREPVAILLRDKNNWADLTGGGTPATDLARLRALVRTDSLHVLHPALKLADGTLIAGHRGITTDGSFLLTEVSFNGMRWYRVDEKTITTNRNVPNPDLSRVDEVGFVDLMPGGGSGTPGGWTNISTIELYAKPVPR